MGADFPEQARAVEEVKTLTPETRQWMGHHFRNSLCAISFLNEIGDAEKVREAIFHIEADLRMFGM